MKGHLGVNLLEEGGDGATQGQIGLVVGADGVGVDGGDDAEFCF